MIKVLLADDQQGMRTIIRKIIEKAGGFEIVAEAEDGEIAIKLFDKHRPELVFLDVEMPKMDGLSAAKEITDADPTVKIVFATAFEQYAREAFEVYAFDYLVKPFDVDRVLLTLNRAKTTHKIAYDTSEKPKQGMFSKELNKLMVKYKEGICFIDMNDICLVQREDRSTVIYTTNRRIVTSEPLGELFKRLDKELFFRSHKSYIINLSMIYEVYPYGRWTYILKLKNIKQDALITYEKFNQLQERFS